jgi:hypothetical protein
MSRRRGDSYTGHCKRHASIDPDDFPMHQPDDDDDQDDCVGVPSWKRQEIQELLDEKVMRETEMLYNFRSCLTAIGKRNRPCRFNVANYQHRLAAHSFYEVLCVERRRNRHMCTNLAVHFLEHMLRIGLYDSARAIFSSVEEYTPVGLHWLSRTIAGCATEFMLCPTFLGFLMQLRAKYKKHILLECMYRLLLQNLYEKKPNMFLWVNYKTAIQSIAPSDPPFLIHRDDVFEDVTMLLPLYDRPVSSRECNLYELLSVTLPLTVDSSSPAGVLLISKTTLRYYTFLFLAKEARRRVTAAEITANTYLTLLPLDMRRKVLARFCFGVTLSETMHFCDLRPPKCDRIICIPRRCQFTNFGSGYWFEHSTEMLKTTGYCDGGCSRKPSEDSSPLCALTDDTYAAMWRDADGNQSELN